MAKCVKCNIRKGKRHCPALGQSICSLCCGQLREKEIHCPPSCSFLAQHKPYQDQRVLEKKHAERPKSFSRERDILDDERLAWLVFNIEIPIAQFAAKESALVDRDALLALEYAREKVEKDKNLLIVPDERFLPKNDLGEVILQSLQQCRFEKNIILPGTIQTYKKEEKIMCLDRVIFAAKQIAGDQIHGQKYLQQLMERLAKLNELSHQPKIITPST
jgi:hypothetical protein